MKQGCQIKTFSCAELFDMQCPPHAPEPRTLPTWTDLVAIEPRLADVERFARELHVQMDDDDLWRWGRIKGAFLPLVGWEADKFPLRNATAYDVAYDYLLDCFDNSYVTQP